MNTKEIIEIHITCPDVATAESIADFCLASQYAACANIGAAIQSRYCWQGKMEREEEVLLMLKTRASLFEQVNAAVIRLHPYEVPCVVGFELGHVNPDYRDWVLSMTQEQESRSTT